MKGKASKAFTIEWSVLRDSRCDSTSDQRVAYSTSGKRFLDCLAPLWWESRSIEVTSMVCSPNVPADVHSVSRAPGGIPLLILPGTAVHLISKSTDLLTCDSVIRGLRGWQPNLSSFRA
jgi:hypothetical protein